MVVPPLDLGLGILAFIGSTEFLVNSTLFLFDCVEEEAKTIAIDGGKELLTFLDGTSVAESSCLIMFGIILFLSLTLLKTCLNFASTLVYYLTFFFFGILVCKHFFEMVTSLSSDDIQILKNITMKYMK